MPSEQLPGIVHKFMKWGVCPNKDEHRQGEEEEDDVDEEIELSLGLSMNGRFGVEIGADRRVLGLVSARHALALARTQSLPVETEEEWCRQKELQSVRRMEARKKRMRTGSSGSSDLIDGLICDRGLTLGHLLGGLHDFFSRLGKFSTYFLYRLILFAHLFLYILTKFYYSLNTEWSSSHALVSGMSKLKFKPAYNPYTEPSMEIFRNGWK